MAGDIPLTGEETVKCRVCGWSGKIQETVKGNWNSPDPSDRKSGIVSKTVYYCPNPNCMGMNLGHGVCLADKGAQGDAPYIGHSESIEAFPRI